jgi:hypothetical protein
MAAQHDALLAQLLDEFLDVVGGALDRVESQVVRRDLWSFLASLSLILLPRRKGRTVLPYPIISGATTRKPSLKNKGI